MRPFKQKYITKKAFFRTSFAAITAAFALTDLLSKALVRRLAVPSPDTVLPLLPVLDIVHSLNTGVAFSMFDSLPRMIVALPNVILVAIMLFLIRNNDRFDTESVAVSLLAGGALGNLYERVFSTGVFDFVRLHIGRYSWPDFNLADVYIVAGAALFAIATLRALPAESSKNEETSIKRKQSPRQKQREK